MVATGGVVVQGAQLEEFFGVLAMGASTQVGVSASVGGPTAWTLWGLVSVTAPKGVLESLAQALGHALLPWRPVYGTLGSDGLAGIEFCCAACMENSTGIATHLVLIKLPFAERCLCLCKVRAG